MDNESNLIWNSYIKESSSYSDDEYPINIITQDNYHEYKIVEGIKYELAGGDSNEKLAYVSDIESTEGNTFYQDHIDRYKEYIENGGIIHSFPVQDISDPPTDIENMVDNLENSSSGDIYEAAYWLFQDKYNIDYKELDRLIELYRDEDSLSLYVDEEENPEDYEKLENEVEQFKTWVKEWYNDETEEQYSLIDHNHRFEAIKQMGIKTTIIDISN
jgi:hypothetical protein